LAVGDGAAVRSGEDERRRGWYWHWNELVTQYAPLIGLKGVGLLNSYTVWTDRREASPHRGYAFPSQQSEADFYGEDRAELITINKILVALDLIEIRKEMVLRTDPQGRRWRVPHNFYRVKDHPDGFTVSTRDVLKVAALADRDKAVYRYVRRAFSPRFSPIDADNPWHRILPELRQTELWQRLAERAAREEDRASARTRAGHAARRASTEKGPRAERRGPSEDGTGGGFFVAEGGDEAATGDGRNDSGGGATGVVGETSVGRGNTGSGPDVGGGNNGFGLDRATSVGGSNGGGATAVGPANTTYHQTVPTTTTTTGRPTQAKGSGTAGTADPAGTDSALGTRHSELAALRAFEEANARPPTPAERNLLRGLAERFDLAALAAAELDPAAPDSGWGWVAAAVYEAVEAGSAFVAPRRLREILLRWEREGYPQEDESTSRGVEESGRGGESTSRPTGGRARERERGSARLLDSSTPRLLDSPDVPLPHGHGSRRTWEFVVGLLGAALDRAALAELVAGTAIVGYRDGEVTVAAPDPAQAERLATTHRELVERKLGEAMRRPVRLAVITADGGRRTADGSSGDPRPGVRGTEASGSLDPRDPEQPSATSFSVAECGMGSDQVWAAVLAEIEAGEAVGRADFDAWLRGARLLGRGGDGGPGSPLVVGAPHAMARRRLTERCLPEIERAVAAVVGVRLPVEIVLARDWRPGTRVDAAPIPTDEPSRGQRVESA